MDMASYLNRISYVGPVKSDLGTLRGLHHANMLGVPFENLDIALKRPIKIDEQSIWEKIITKRRGGFCYELNGLFAWLLKEIGFDVTYLNGRVFDSTGKPGIDFDHLVLLVKFPQQPAQWIADVGFGDSFTLPLNLSESAEQSQGLRAYRLESIRDRYVMWQKNYDGAWERQYLFDLQPHTFPDEYESGCLYQQTSPQSSFTRKSIISRATEDGRVSLEDRRLIVTKLGKRTERPLTGNDEYYSLLSELFGVELASHS